MHLFRAGRRGVQAAGTRSPQALQQPESRDAIQKMDAVRLIMARARAVASLVCAFHDVKIVPQGVEDVRAVIRETGARKAVSLWLRLRLVGGESLIDGARAAQYTTLASWCGEIVEEATTAMASPLNDAQSVLAAVCADPESVSALWGHGITSHWGSVRVVSVRGLGYVVAE